MKLIKFSKDNNIYNEGDNNYGIRPINTIVNVSFSIECSQNDASSIMNYLNGYTEKPEFLFEMKCCSSLYHLDPTLYWYIKEKCVFNTRALLSSSINYIKNIKDIIINKKINLNIEF